MLTEPLTFVMPCMGRLAHLQQTLPLVLTHTQANVCVVDYSCPDQCASWVEWMYARDPRVLAVRAPGHVHFNKCAALNQGYLAAGERWPGWLGTLDADTLVTRALWWWLAEYVEPGNFYFVEGDRDRRDLSGLLVVHQADFLRSERFDERFACWGAEDFDMRCRLYFQLGMPYTLIPSGLADSLPHSDLERVEHYPVKDLEQGHTQNQYLVVENLRRWTGRDVSALACPVVSP